MGDSLDLNIAEPKPDRSATAWLVMQAIGLLNSVGFQSEAGYRHVVELLADREDATEEVARLLRAAPAEDVSLRWSALYVAGDFGSEATGELLLRQALEGVPERKEEDGCEGVADGELLIRTMAVEALKRVAERHESARDLVIRLIEERPARPVLVEAVKAARDLDLLEKAGELVRKRDRWMLDICPEPIQNIAADPERVDDVDPIRAAPGMDDRTVATPRADCHTTHLGRE